MRAPGRRPPTRSAVRFLGLLAVLAGAVLVRRRRTAHPEGVELFFADGSSAAFTADSPQGERLLPLARRALASARS